MQFFQTSNSFIIQELKFCKITQLIFVSVSPAWEKLTENLREFLFHKIPTIAEDDKEGVMADKVLNLFWNLAHSNDVAIDIMDQALSAHIKILDYRYTKGNTLKEFQNWQITEC